MSDNGLPPAAAPETFAVQGGGVTDAATGAVFPGIQLATTYVRDPDNQYRSGYSYRRDDNPNVRQAEAVLQNLEAGVVAGRC